MNNKTALIEDKMKSAQRKYKAGINRAKLEHRRLFVHKLRKHKHTNSWDYWKLLGEKKKNKANIPLNLLKDHFKRLIKTHQMCFAVQICSNVYKSSLLAVSTNILTMHRYTVYLILVVIIMQ